MEKAEEAGVNEYTTKPIDKDKLFRCMLQLINEIAASHFR